MQDTQPHVGGTSMCPGTSGQVAGGRVVPGWGWGGCLSGFSRSPHKAIELKSTAHPPPAPHCPVGAGAAHLSLPVRTQPQQHRQADCDKQTNQAVGLLQTVAMPPNLVLLCGIPGAWGGVGGGA